MVKKQVGRPYQIEYFLLVLEEQNHISGAYMELLDEVLSEQCHVVLCFYRESQIYSGLPQQ